MSSAITNGLRVTVASSYIADQSAPLEKRYAFAYRIRIENESDKPLQLISRHWIITDNNGRVEDVRGPGVVGQQPKLQPGESFEYTSGAVLETHSGAMRGTYLIEDEAGNSFEAEIAEFQLSFPRSLN